MSQNTIDYSKNFMVDCQMSVNEYYAFRLLAIYNKVMFTVKWEKTHCIVTTEAPFLVSVGFTGGIDF
jgi:hypothetical protein